MTPQDLPVAFLDEEGEAFTTSLVIAKGTNVQHKNVLELVRTYLPDLEEFGGVAFQTRLRSHGQRGSDTEYAELNEQQSTLILTYMLSNNY